MEQSVSSSSSIASGFMSCLTNASDHVVANIDDFIAYLLALIAESLGEFTFQPNQVVNNFLCVHLSRHRFECYGEKILPFPLFIALRIRLYEDSKNLLFDIFCTFFVHFLASPSPSRSSSALSIKWI
jgi:hypothetical protein